MYKQSIIFMGTPDFALPALKAIHETGYNLIGIISQPNRASGRKQIIVDTPVAAYARQNNLDLFQPKSINSDEAKEYLESSKVDLIITAAYGQILTEEILNIPRLGCLNIHASLLPKYRGAAPINAAIINQEDESGVTIMQMDVGCDTGDILYKKAVKIGSKETAGELFHRLAQLGSEAIIEFLPDFFDGNFKAEPQDPSQATYAAKMDRDAGLINWEDEAEKIEALIRGTQPWPGSFTFFENKRLKIYSAEIIKQDDIDVKGFKAGELIDCSNGLIVQCGKDALKLHDIQFASGKKMDSSICSHNYQERQRLGR